MANHRKTPTHTFSVRVTLDQHQELLRRAKAAELALGPYLVATALDMAPDTPHAMKEIEALKRQVASLERRVDLVYPE